MTSGSKPGTGIGKMGWALLCAAGMAGYCLPAQAQDQTVQELRLRQLEAQVRELNRQLGVQRTVAPQNGPVTAPAPVAGAPASSPLTDMLTRMDAVEAQVARLTAQNEELANKLRQMQAAEAAAAPAAAAGPGTPLTTPPPAPAPIAASTTTPAGATSTNLSAMTGAAPEPAPRPAAKAPPAKPSAQRLAAVKAIVKPQTDDPGDDEYSYGYRLYAAGFLPESAQQLKLFIDKYPRHARMSQARNLLGRALLEDGKPREAAPWFLQNYKADPQGIRAGDSLLNLADAMRQLGDTTRACIALGEFATNYPDEAKGRLRSEYGKLKGAVTCP